MTYTLLDTSSFLQGRRGALTVLDSPPLPFPIKRVFWIYGVESPKEERGQHTHLYGDEILIAVQGRVHVKLTSNGISEEICLSKSTTSKALWIHKGSYIEMSNFTPDCILLVLCSHAFKDDPVVGLDGTMK